MSKRNGRDRAIPATATVPWPEGVQKALSELGAANKAFPKLFPHGVTRIELEFAASERSRISIVIVGPDKAALGSQEVAVADPNAAEVVPAEVSLGMASSPTDGQSTAPSKGRPSRPRT